MKPNKKMRAAIAEWVKQEKHSNVCPACSGSGYYDVKNSPKCGSCNGTGKVKA